jgi:hypothetical protein
VRLKQQYCPQCVLVTVDPTLQAHQGASGRSYGERFKFCSARKTLEYFGLSHEAETREGFGADLLQPLPLPIGFAYFDDGKIREAMAPQLALIESVLMDGAYLAYDDYAQKHHAKGPVKTMVADHAELMRELASSGDFETLVGSESANYGLQRRVPRPKLASGIPDAWAEIELELVEKASRSTVSRAVLAVPSAADAGLSVALSNGMPAWRPGNGASNSKRAKFGPGAKRGGGGGAKRSADSAPAKKSSWLFGRR